MRLFKILAQGFALATLSCASLPASADSNPAFELNRLDRPSDTVGTLGSNLFGESVDLYRGTTSFDTTDISIPGNSALPVSLGRHHNVVQDDLYGGLPSFANWEIDLPYLTGYFSEAGWTVQAGSLTTPSTNRCSLSAPATSPVPPTVVATIGGVQIGGIDGNKYWSGNMMYVPGAGTQELLLNTTGSPSPSGTYPWITKNRWVIGCLSGLKSSQPGPNNGGEGFVATSPSGTKYYFDTMLWVTGDTSVQVQYTDPNSHAVDTAYIGRTKYWLVPSKIVDRFGNTVTYTYNANQLTDINGDDGRHIHINWGTNGAISDATDGAHTWRYSYGTVGDSNTVNPLGLTQVVLPDSSSWSYQYTGDLTLISPTPPLPNDTPWLDNPTCNIPFPRAQVAGPWGYTLTATHPSGTTGVFTFNPVIRGRSKDPNLCSDTGGVPQYPNNTIQYAITSKTLSGPGLPATATGAPTDVWTYTYSPPNNSWTNTVCSPAPCPTTVWTEVTNPDGTDLLTTFGNQYGLTEGHLLETTLYTDTTDKTVLDDHKTTYWGYASGQPFQQYIGQTAQPYEDVFVAQSVNPVQMQTEVRDGVTFTTHVTGYDTFANPVTTISSSSLGFTRTDVTAYSQNTNLWVLNQVASVTNTNTGTIEFTRQYDPNTALLLDVYGAGPPGNYLRPDETYTFNADGTLATATDGNGHTTTLGNYHRGVPQNLQFADTTAKSAQVDDYGHITSLTDETGYTSTFGYDAMGRLSTINQPTGDSVAWSPTNISFVQVPYAELGLAAGHWKQVVSTSLSSTQAGVAAQANSAAQAKLALFNQSAKPLDTLQQGGGGGGRPIGQTVVYSPLSIALTTNGTTFAASTPIALSAIATPAVVSSQTVPLSQIILNDNGTPIASMGSSPNASYTWTTAAAGTHQLTAVATDVDNDTATSSAITVTVTATQPCSSASGNGASSVTYYDGLWQPVVTAACDAGNPTATTRVSTRSFDYAGRTTFSSYPVAGIVNYNDALNGVHTTYDGLGRMLTSAQDSELGPLTTSYAYLPGFQTQVTNPRGNATTTSYQVFGSPDTSHPSQIVSPMGATTKITRDVFGKPLSLIRADTNANSGADPDGGRSVTRSYVYDTLQRLCKRVEPETGATLISYDGANNIAWTTSGSTLTSLSQGAACEADRNSVPVASQTVRTYDLRNRPLTVNIPNSINDIAYSYYADGALKTLGNGPSMWSYTYNKRRLPVIEQHVIDTQSKTITHGYDVLGHENSLIYPSGLFVATNPNALGQPTQAGTFATGVSYFPNGGMSGFNYGNGIVHSLTENTRELPLRSLDLKPGAAEILDDTYGYDPNGNVATIADGTAGGNSRTMGYDALDRLTGTSAPAGKTWTAASNTYDALDNILTSNVGNSSVNRNDVYTYDSTNRLHQITGGLAYTFGYDANGNITSKGTGKDSYVFDAANRMTSVVGKESYAYDGYGRRVKITRTSDGKIDYPLYGLGGELITDDDQRANTTTDFVSLNGSLVAKNIATLGTTSYATTYEHTDALRSPVAETNASGVGTSTQRYTPYGEPGTYVQGPGYTGHVTDAATGLTYAQQRYYDPVVGRFPSPDPVLTDPNTGAHWNRYAYANDNPYRFTDPDGRAACSPPSSGPCDGAAGTATFAGTQMHDAGAARAGYADSASKLSPTDSAGRAALKLETRANTPSVVGAVVAAARPGVDAEKGSGGTANASNAAANAAGKALRVAGGVAAVATVAVQAYDVAHSPEPTRALANAGGTTLGGVAGGEAGAIVGAEIGSFGGPIGTAVGAVVGGVVGAYGGGTAGGAATTNIYDYSRGN